MIKNFLVICFLFVSFFAFADEATLIDFSKLSTANAIDFSSYTQGFVLSEPKVSLEANNWNVNLNTSADTVEAKIKSYTTVAASKINGSVLGIRAFFPSTVAHAYILPPFPIPAYSNIDFSGSGLVKNVELIKEVRVSVYGHNIAHNLFVILQDQTGRMWEVGMGNLQFAGWKDLMWQNDGYITDVRDREITVSQSYPASLTYVRLVGFRVAKSIDTDEGDFITYIKSVNIVYDKSIIETEKDIDDEAVWGLLKDKEAQTTLELQKAAYSLYLKEQEKLLMHK